MADTQICMNKDQLLRRLFELTSTMDVPDHKRRNPKWLVKNLAARNANHDNFKEALMIATDLYNNGITNG